MARGRPPGSPKIPGSGRVAGKSLDKQARQLVSADLAGSILATFEMLGGTAAMVEWAHDNKSIFYTQILSRLMPAPQKDDDSTINNYTQINNLSDRDAAVRVAFALSTALYGDPSVTVEHDAPLVERVPEEPPQRMYQGVPWRAPADAPGMLPPEPMTPQEAEWAAGLPLTPAERANQKLIRQTKEASITNYAGSSSEQGGGAAHSRPVERDPRGEQRDRILARRRSELL
ncbi:hypothetical protein [Pseudomonas fluorescens group sp. PF-69]